MQGPCRKGYWGLALACLRHPSFLMAYMHLQVCILMKYVLPQFSPRAAWRAVRLATPEDASIPYETRAFRDYLAFWGYWNKPLGMAFATRRTAALPDMLCFTACVRKCFSAAHEVYRVQPSSMSRPFPGIHLWALGVRLFDANAFCLPSLHVMLVCLTRMHRPRLLGEDSEAEFAATLDEQALRITESVLLVKQHSLCDIPTALFYLTALGEGLGPKGDEAFLASLFRDWPQGETLRSFVLALYRHLGEQVGEQAGDRVCEQTGAQTGAQTGEQAGEKTVVQTGWPIDEGLPLSSLAASQARDVLLELLNHYSPTLEKIRLTVALQTASTSKA